MSDGEGDNSRSNEEGDGDFVGGGSLSGQILWEMQSLLELLCGSVLGGQSGASRAGVVGRVRGVHAYPGRAALGVGGSSPVRTTPPPSLVATPSWPSMPSLKAFRQQPRRHPATGLSAFVALPVLRCCAQRLFFSGTWHSMCWARQCLPVQSPHPSAGAGQQSAGRTPAKQNTLKHFMLPQFKR